MAIWVPIWIVLKGAAAIGIRFGAPVAIKTAVKQATKASVKQGTKIVRKFVDAKPVPGTTANNRLQAFDKYRKLINNRKAAITVLSAEEIKSEICSVIAKGNTTSEEDDKGLDCTITRFQLRYIPDVMEDELGWSVAAKLMERWFTTGPWEIEEKYKYPADSDDPFSDLDDDHIDDGKIVTMKWANTFENLGYAKKVLLSRLGMRHVPGSGIATVAENITMNNPTKDMILKRLIRDGWVPPDGIKLSSFIESDNMEEEEKKGIKKKYEDIETKSSKQGIQAVPSYAPFYLGTDINLKSAKEVNDRLQINTIRVIPGGDGQEHGVVTVLDEWAGALGLVQIKVAVTGMAYINKETKLPEFHVRSIGFYVQDWYDFSKYVDLSDYGLGRYDIEPEYLGIWHPKGAIAVPWVAKVIPSEEKKLNPQNQDDKGLNYAFITNLTFRAWRKEHNNGGDFLLFSDVEWLQVTSSMNKDKKCIIKWGVEEAENRQKINNMVNAVKEKIEEGKKLLEQHFFK